MVASFQVEMVAVAEYLTLDISVCLAGFAGMLGERGSWGSWPPIPVPSVGPALGRWVKEGLGLVVHFLSGCIAKINTP